MLSDNCGCASIQNSNVKRLKILPAIFPLDCRWFRAQSIRIGTCRALYRAWKSCGMNVTSRTTISSEYSIQPFSEKYLFNIFSVWKLANLSMRMNACVSPAAAAILISVCSIC